MDNQNTGVNLQPSSSCTSAPFFIFGCGRSGTSLLSRMLNQHPNLAVPYESHLFNTFIPWLRYYGDLSAENNRRRLVCDILATDVMNDWHPRLHVEQVMTAIERHDFGGIVDAVLCSWTKMQQKSRWGEKTPHHAYYWDHISQFFHDAKVIHIVRDGRDVALSLIKARFGPKTIYKCAKYWSNFLDTMDELRNKIEPMRFHEIRYEDLLEDLESTLKTVCAFLQEPFSAEMLEFYKNDACYPTDRQNMENLKRPVLRNNKEKWRYSMSVRNLKLFEAVAHDKLVQYNYQIANSYSPISPIEKAYCEYVEGIPPKLFAMLKNAKGHRDSWIRFRIKIRLRLWDRVRFNN